MDYSTIAVMMALLTLFLLVAEFFIPSGGLISVVALLCGTISVWGAYKAWAETSPVIWWAYLILFFSLIPAALGTVLVILPKTKYGRKLLLEPTPAGETRAYLQERRELEKLVGKRGKTATLHTPGGFVVVENRRFHSESEGLLIEPDTLVEVVATSGTRLVVREIDPDAEQEPAENAEPETPPPETEPSRDREASESPANEVARPDLDFQVPDD
jgi:membrane-bound ClpP family serine protease